MRARTRRRLLIALAALAAGYLALAGGLFLAQRALIYPAPHGPGGRPAGFAPVTYETADGLALTAGYRPAQAGRPTILYFHGNGADWQSSAVATGRLVPQGYGVLAAEYRGYRGNPGRPSEHGLYADGRAALAFLRRRGVEPSAVVIVGNSIGSGVAVQMAREHPVGALVLVSPFASLSQVVAEQFPWLPTALLLRDRFENIDKIGAIDAPVLILHGDADRLIPPAHARALAARQPAAELAIVAGAGHELAWRAEAEERMLAFLDRLPAGPSADPEPRASGNAGGGDMRPGDEQP